MNSANMRERVREKERERERELWLVIKINVFWISATARALFRTRASLFFYFSSLSFANILLYRITTGHFSPRASCRAFLFFPFFLLKFSVRPSLSLSHSFDCFRISHFLFNVAYNMLYPVYSNLNFRSHHITQNEIHTCLHTHLHIYSRLCRPFIMCFLLFGVGVVFIYEIFTEWISCTVHAHRTENMFRWNMVIGDGVVVVGIV